MKKILSLILCLAMLLSLGTLAISAEKVSGTDSTVIYANYGEATVDGLKDATMHIGTLQNNSTSGSFAVGATWNADTLVVGVSGVVVFNNNDWSSNKIRTRAYPFIRGGLYFENGASVNGTKANGLAANSVQGSAFAMAAESTILAVDHYGGAAKGYTTGVFYVEYSIPMSALNFYDMGDGTLATQLLVEWVGLLANQTNEQYLSDNCTLVLTDNAVIGDRDSLGVTGTPTYTKSHLNGAQTVNVQSAPAWVKFQSNTTLGARAYISTGATAAMPAGVASVAEATISLYSLPSTTGPVTAEDWTYAAYSDRATVSSSSNPSHMVLAVAWAKNGNNAKALVGYSIYNVNGEVRLYSTEATSANAPYVVLTGVAASGTHAAGHTLRLEFDASYNATVVLDGRKIGTLAAPTVTELNEDHPLYHYIPDELTIWGITGADLASVNFAVSNTMVATESAAAVTALNTIKANQMFTVYGHQDTIKAENGVYSLRFLAELPAKLDDYTALGYDVVITNDNGTATTTVELNKVYDRFLAYNKAEDKYEAVDLDGLVAAFALRDIEVADGDCTVIVKPWVVTKKGGEKLYGTAYSVTYTAAGDGTLSFE